MNRNRLPYKCALIICLLTFGFYCSTAQNISSTQLSAKHENYFNDLRENVYLHLNKTAFYTGEQLWFTAYLFDQKVQKPSIKSSNLHVGIFDEKGNKISQKMIYLKDGIGYGNIAIDSSFIDKDYYIKAETNWMQNFKESKAFVQNFTVLNQPAYSFNKYNEPNSDFLIQPEGGQLISNLKNTIAFKVRDSLGVGYQLSNIELVNDLDEVIKNNISTSKHGLGKISFRIKNGRSYFLRAKNNNNSFIRTRLPKAKNSGLLLSLNQVYGEIIGKLSINKQELGRWLNKPLYLAIHRNGQISIQEFSIQSEETVISIDKSEIPFGINSITVLDATYNPIVNRLFFNEAGIENRVYQDLIVGTQLNTSKDSLIIQLNDRQQLLDTLFLSISALPKETISYSPRNSLSSSFLFSPYVDPSILSNYEFENMDRSKLFEIDILMVLNGSGVFNWDSIVKGAPEVKHPFELNIEIEGKILDANLTKEKRIWGSVTGKDLNFFAEIKSDKTIKANPVLFEGDSLKIALLNNNGKLRRPKAEITFPKSMQIQPLKPSPSKYIYFKEKLDLEDNLNNDYFDTGRSKSLTKEVTKLDEVVLVAKKNLNNEIPINVADFSGKRITNEDIKRRGTLENYLRKLGYRISINGGSVTVISRTPSPTSMGQRVPVPVFIGGMIADGSSLLNKPLSTIQAIYYDSFGYKFISIVPRYDFYSASGRKNHKTFFVKKGFTKPEAYYDPGYYNYQTREFKQFGVIGWFPKITITSWPTSIKIPILEQEQILLLIEGMSSDGRLISIKKEIKTLIE